MVATSAPQRQRPIGGFIGFVPALRELAIQVVVQNFEKDPDLSGLPAEDVEEITSRLPLDLDIELAGTCISNEEYWRRRSQKRWRNCDPTAHGQSWKQLYFELNLQDTLEIFDPAASVVDELRRMMTFSSRFVRQVNLQQLPSHLDLQNIFQCLGNNLCALTLKYGLRQVGMDYDKAMFGMRLPDCRSLARALESTETLTYLNLSGNGLDDDKARMVLSGMVDNISITHLDLSQNKIADRGVRALAKLLDTDSVISILNLRDNLIHAEGGRALARSIKSSASLTQLDVSMNRIGDEGAVALCHVAQESQLRCLRMAANAVTGASAAAIADLLSTNPMIRELDLSANELGPDAGPPILAALKSPQWLYPESTSGQLSVLSLKRCGLQPHDELQVSEVLRAKRDKLIEEEVAGPV